MGLVSWEYVSIDDLKPHPKNPNKHSDEQIQRLAELLQYQGFRVPIVVSKTSGFIVAGHGRLEAAMRLKLTMVPVSTQEFTEEQEYAFLVSDNAIANWAQLDLSQINSDIGSLGPDFNIEMLGLKDFNIVPEFDPGVEEDQGKLDEKKPLVTQCPNCGECFDANENKPKS